MKARGWKSKDTLQRALVELLGTGMIEKTRQGGLHCPTLYAFTWLPIEECGGKLDVKATSVPSNLWRQSERGGDISKKQIATPTVGAHRPDYRGKDGEQRTDYGGALPRPSGLNRPFGLFLCPDHRAPSKNLPSGSAEVDVARAGKVQP
jgi:hypothetical protein